MIPRKKQKIQPVLIHEKERPWEGTAGNHLGDATWRTLLSGDTTPSLHMTCGIVEVGKWQGGEMVPHQHPQSEVYHVLEGQGVVTIEGEDYVLDKGSTLFIPGGCEHGTRNTADCPLKIFMCSRWILFRRSNTYFLPTIPEKRNSAEGRWPVTEDCRGKGKKRGAVLPELRHVEEHAPGKYRGRVRSKRAMRRKTGNKQQ